MKRYFITGTDTDCGKTYVTQRLLHYFPHAAAIKPVASGCELFGDQLVSADAQQLHKRSDLSLEVMNPWRFQAPIAPHLAAQNEGISLSSKEIASYCLDLQLEGIERLFIEGAGGLMVPLNEQETWLDFLKISDIPVIFVVAMKLGCINHALLSETVLEANKIQCVGWIANCIDPDMEALAENIATLMKKLKSQHLATVDFGGEVLDLNYHLI